MSENNYLKTFVATHFDAQSEIARHTFNEIIDPSNLTTPNLQWDNWYINDTQSGLQKVSDVFDNWENVLYAINHGWSDDKGNNLFATTPNNQVPANDIGFGWAKSDTGSGFTPINVYDDFNQHFGTAIEAHQALFNNFKTSEQYINTLFMINVGEFPNLYGYWDYLQEKQESNENKTEQFMLFEQIKQNVVHEIIANQMFDIEDFDDWFLEAEDPNNYHILKWDSSHSNSDGNVAVAFIQHIQENPDDTRPFYIKMHNDTCECKIKDEYVGQVLDNWNTWQHRLNEVEQLLEPNLMELAPQFVASQKQSLNIKP